MISTCINLPHITNPVNTVAKYLLLFFKEIFSIILIFIDYGNEHSRKIYSQLYYNEAWFFDWNWIYTFLQAKRTLKSERVVSTTSSTSIYATVDNCFCSWSWTRFCNDEPCKMLNIKCHVNVDRMIPDVLCVASVTDSPVPMACTLAFKPISYLNWLACRLFDMRIWWRLTSFGDITVGAMVWQIAMSFRSTSLDTTIFYMWRHM